MEVPRFFFQDRPWVFYRKTVNNGSYLIFLVIVIDPSTYGSGSGRMIFQDDENIFRYLVLVQVCFTWIIKKAISGVNGGAINLVQRIYEHQSFCFAAPKLSANHNNNELKILDNGKVKRQCGRWWRCGGT